MLTDFLKVLSLKNVPFIHLLTILAVTFCVCVFYLRNFASSKAIFIFSSITS